MRLELDEEDIESLRHHVREATRSLVPRRHEAPTSAWVTMGYGGGFDNHHSWNEEPSFEIIAVSLSVPTLRKSKPLVQTEDDPSNPHRIKVECVSPLIGHLEEQIKEFVKERLAELASQTIG